MKQKLKIFSVLTLAVIAAGCSSVTNHFASHVEKEPTLNGLKWSTNESKVYLRTMYVQADFQENGQKREFKDYDYTQETSPCTAIKKYSPRTNVYTIEHDKKTLSFECRPYFSYDQPDLRRLYLLGSTRDCDDRTWDYQAPMVDSFLDVKMLCRKNSKKDYKQEIESTYKDWVKLGILK